MTEAVHADIHAETYSLNSQVMPVNEFPLCELYLAHGLVADLFYV